MEMVHQEQYRVHLTTIMRAITKNQFSVFVLRLSIYALSSFAAIFYPVCSFVWLFRFEHRIAHILQHFRCSDSSCFSNFLRRHSCSDSYCTRTIGLKFKFTGVAQAKKHKFQLIRHSNRITLYAVWCRQQVNFHSTRINTSDTEREGERHNERGVIPLNGKQWNTTTTI